MSSAASDVYKRQIIHYSFPSLVQPHLTSHPFTHMSATTHIYLQTHIHIHLHSHTYPLTSLHTHLLTPVHTHTPVTHTHLYTHIHIHSTFNNACPSTHLHPLTSYYLLSVIHTHIHPFIRMDIPKPIHSPPYTLTYTCLLYTSDAADDIGQV